MSVLFTHENSIVLVLNANFEKVEFFKEAFLFPMFSIY